MPNKIKDIPRDGTSQRSRVLAALDPSYVGVDERTAADFVEFARTLGPQLVYHGLDDKPVGTFAEFVGPVNGAVSPSVIAAYLDHPERFDPATSPALFRPHFVLFLVFAKLLEKAQIELNSLTARHLDFYYRRFLGMVHKGPIPDQLNLIVNLSPRGKEVLVPKGTALSAGPDSRGQDLIYATDRDLVVNRAQVARLSSLFVDRRLIGFKETRALVAPRSQIALLLLQLALGDPLPGAALPPYPGPGGTALDATSLAARLLELDALTQVTSTSQGYYLSLGELRELIGLKQVTVQQTAEWLKNNATLSAELADQWNKVNGVLALAGQRKQDPAAYPLPTRLTPQDFTAHADDAVGSVAVLGKGMLGLEKYYAALLELEAYFHMTAESFHQLYQELLVAAVPDWQLVDALLEAAYATKVRDDRRSRLAQLHSDPTTRGLADLIHEVMGNDTATEEDLLPFLGKPTDLATIKQAVQDANWDSVYRLLEVAQSNRLGEPGTHIEQWLNLYPAADATQVGFRGQGDAPASSPRWATFGLPTPSNPTAPPAPVLGWAISSPLLALGEGERTITLTLGFDGNSTDQRRLTALLAPSLPAPLPLSFAVSTAKGWIACTAVEVTVGMYDTLTKKPPAATPAPAGMMKSVGVLFKLRFGTTVGAISALPPELAPGPAPAGGSPTLRLLLQPVWNVGRKQYVTQYQELSALLLVAAQLQVAVTGLRTIKLQNDDSVLDAKKPFEPFGSMPAVGSRLLLGHPEIVQKQLDSLTFNVKWMGAPANFADYYATYELTKDAPKAFTTRISWVDRTQVVCTNTAAPLFGEVTTPPPETSVPADPAIKIPLTSKDSQSPALPAIGAEGAFGEDLSTWTRYLQWELNAPDFHHSVFTAVASRKALQLAADIANKASGATTKTLDYASYSVNPPYTPKIKSLTIDYCASQEVTVAGAALASDAVRMLHIHPFGQCSIEAERTAAGVPFLPRYEHDGELYIGLANVVPPQTVALLFQLAEGSSDPDLDPQTIEWSYLDGDRWVALGSGVTWDTTRGLLNSGIIELALKPVQPSTRLAAGLYWVRAAIARNTAVVSDTIAIQTQGVSATLRNSGNAADHFAAPLPPGKVTKLMAPIPLITGVSQPYPSFGGRMGEDDGMTATRVSQRLRHKQRALSMWDYEQLVLERFPEVYKAKCVPAGPDDRGKVGIVIIPNTKNLVLSDPFAPKAAARLLLDIAAYLGPKTPAFVTVKVKNARYVPVRVRLRVRFTDPGNDSYYTQKLNDELNRFLSPWAYEDGADIVLGGNIYANSIIDFVDRRPYVDYVAGVTLFRSDGNDNFSPAGSDFVAAGTADAVLVAARTHIIDVLHDAIYQETSVTGIGFMKVELDFIIRA